MTSRLERVYDDAVAIGKRNQRVVDLSRNHCLHVEFHQIGGYSEVEAQTGLPISMRRVHCAYGSASATTTGGMNLEFLAVGFYRSNCVGCAHRSPTGRLPTLAGFVEELDAADARRELESQQQAAADHTQWATRVERRRALAVGANPAMAAALEDVGLVDLDPLADGGWEAATAACERLKALAARAPELFADDVVEHVASLIQDQRLVSLLEPLRLLASALPQHRPLAVSLAFHTLDGRLNRDAGRCVASFPEQVSEDLFTPSVVANLIRLVGSPQVLGVGAYRPAIVSTDASPLRLAADVVPDRVSQVLSELLRLPRPKSPLILPAGSSRAAAITAASDSDRCAAAGAVRRLAATHAELASGLAFPLVSNLSVDEDPHGSHPIADVQYTLAVMLVRGVGDVATAVLGAAGEADEQVRRRLFGVFSRVRSLLDRQERWREPGDPVLAEADRRSCFRGVVDHSFARLGGDWGDKVALDAADLLKSLASDEAAWMIDDLPAVAGAVVLTIDAINAGPPPTPLHVVDPRPAELVELERAARQRRLGGVVQRLLDVLERLATQDLHGVLAAMVEILAIDESRTTEPTIARTLVPLLGRLGRLHGHEPGALNKILPRLYTYLLGTDVLTRARALSAWAEVGRRHPVPSSLGDLLPALLQDRYAIVARSLLTAAVGLDWTDADRTRLLAHAFGVADGAPDTDTLQAAVQAILALSQGQEYQARAEYVVLEKCQYLDSYELEIVLQHRWHPEVQRSAQMAALRLAQARDPDVGDRVNDREDSELTALLECGAGLLAVPTAELRAAAVELGPDMSFVAAQYAEVAWRAARAHDAADIMTAIVRAIPDRPAFEYHRLVATAIGAMAALDSVAGTTAQAGPEWQAAIDACAALAADDSGDWLPYLRELGQQISPRLRARALLANQPMPALPSFDDSTSGERSSQPASAEPASANDEVDDLLQRADALSGVAQHLAQHVARQTPTAAYMRAYAALCTVAAHLLRYDAAELNAEAAQARAQHTAATRRAQAAAAQVSRALDGHDPLGTRVRSALDEAASITTGDQVGPMLVRWAALPMPLLFVHGPHVPAGRSQPSPKPTDPAKVAVVITHIDDMLVTGPLVLRPTTVYTLRLEVRTDGWPDWADRLDAEFVSHLSDAEIEMPSFTWSRPPQDAHVPGTLAGEGTLVLRFRLAAGRPAPPFRVALSYRGDRDGERRHQRCEIAGHVQLRMRPFDASRDAKTKYPVVDERLLKLYEHLHGAGYDEDQIQGFCRLLTAISAAGHAMTFETRYRRGTKVTERQFHDDLHQRLMKNHELGGRVERGTRLALGFVDVRHDGITAELKVSKTAVTPANITKYIGQPTQYASADGARLSILCVLDMSLKASPIATAENYLWTLTPDLHGLTNPEAPSIVAALVINGNLPTPSSWSRRRIRATHIGGSP
ncbi:hypothetical protein AB0J72_47900 [Dactylosporangium sp. NPDC049742]|uniref:hypothetical protein n=1 Tax=Dactylosporangium sp. NPDC049742 TaxID=3154737 RepID=UPI00342B7C3D